MDFLKENIILVSDFKSCGNSKGRYFKVFLKSMDATFTQISSFILWIIQCLAVFSIVSKKLFKSDHDYANTKPNQQQSKERFLLKYSLKNRLKKLIGDKTFSENSIFSQIPFPIKLDGLNSLNKLDSDANRLNNF